MKTSLEIAREALEKIASNINEVPGARLYALDTARQALSDIEAAEKKEKCWCGGSCLNHKDFNFTRPLPHNSQSGGDPFGAEDFNGDLQQEQDRISKELQPKQECKHEGGFYCAEPKGERICMSCQQVYKPNPQPLYGIDKEKLEQLIVKHRFSGHEDSELGIILSALKPIKHE